jgi:predicted lipoprotein with Yx(FWY)xxD motif
MSISTSPTTSVRWFRRVKTSSKVLLLGAAGVLLFAISPVGASTHHVSKSVVISTASSKKFGTYLVSGLTLYQLNESDCSSAKCRMVWPPLLLPKGVTKATAGHGVNAAKLGTTKLANGSLQVTYGGKALFWFYKDTAPGQVKGANATDQWGKWTLDVTVKPNSSGSSTTTTTSPKSGGTTTTTTGSGGAGATTTTTRPSPTTTTTSPGGGGIAF